jgi:hypothetical protein
MERDCEHGQLARSCNICDLERDLKLVTEQRDKLLAALEQVPEGWPDRIPAGLPEFDALLDHIYEHGTAAEGINERAAALVRAMLEAAPQPPELSDERILEIAAKAEAQWNAVADQYNQWGQLGFDEIVILISRAIEREILGGRE